MYTPDEPDPVESQTDWAPLIRTYSLEEVAALVLSPDDIPNGVRWLNDQIRAGKVSAYKAVRRWRMTHADVEDLIERRRNNVRPSSSKRVAVAEQESDPDAPIINGKPYGGMTRRSWLYHTRAEIPGTTQYARRYGRRHPSPQPPPPSPISYKMVKPESEAVIFNMPPLTEPQIELLERVRREREVVVDGDARKVVESLVRRNLIAYEVRGNRGDYRFTLRPM